MRALLVLMMAVVMSCSAADAKNVFTPQVLKARGPGWTFVFRYPKLSVPGALMGVRGMVAEFNAGMRGLAEAELKSFKQQVVDWRKDAPAGGCEQDTTYAVLHGEGVISVKFEQFQYMQPAAHPWTTVITRNWVPGEGFVTLSDLFEGDWGFQSLSRQVGVQVKIEGQKDGWAESTFASGYGPDPANFTAFAMCKDGMKVFFQRGQVAAGAVGNPSVTVPWKALQGSFKAWAWKVIEGL